MRRSTRQTIGRALRPAAAPAPLCLSIVQDAPEIFRNQQYGKHHTMLIKVQLSNGSVAIRNPAPHAVLALGVSLVYADTLAPVQSLATSSKKQILMVSKQDDIGADGEGLIHVRLNDVSRNHCNRSFRIRIDAQGGLVKVKPVLTRAILCISKSKRKREAPPPMQRLPRADDAHDDDATESDTSSASSSEERAPKRLCSAAATAAASCATTSAASSTAWTSSATIILSSLEWRAIGATPQGRALYQCGVCGALTSQAQAQKRCHARGCRLEALLRVQPPPTAPSGAKGPVADMRLPAEPVSGGLPAPPRADDDDDGLALLPFLAFADGERLANLDDVFFSQRGAAPDAAPDAALLRSSNGVSGAASVERWVAGEWPVEVDAGGDAGAAPPLAELSCSAAAAAAAAGSDDWLLGALPHFV